jgi:hypothetical protein
MYKKTWKPECTELLLIFCCEIQSITHHVVCEVCSSGVKETNYRAMMKDTMTIVHNSSYQKFILVDYFQIIFQILVEMTFGFDFFREITRIDEISKITHVGEHSSRVITVFDVLSLVTSFKFMHLK